MSDATTSFPQPRSLGPVNLLGLWTLTRREIARFVEVYPQTITAPLVTTLLFYAVFALALGGAERTILGLPYMAYLAPGLVMMSMAQNAFANSSTSLVLSKVQGNIVDLLMAPLSPLEMTLGYTLGSVARGVSVGVVTLAVLWLFAPLRLADPASILIFGILGSMMLGLMGLITGIWSEKFDHMATAQNFIVMPATFLSGTFYAVQQLPENWRFLCHLNPFYYMIDGFRYGLTGIAEASPALGALVLLASNLALFFVAWNMFRSGTRLKS